MSGYTCRETYYNYGSYLRSRGYDQAICNLFTEIEAGKVKVGPIVPHGECNVTINGNVVIQNCDQPTKGAGILSLWGGSADDPLAYSNFGLQAYTGAHFVGPIVQSIGGNVVATPNNPAGAWNEFSNNTTFSGDVTIKNDATVDGTLDVTGPTSLSTVNTSGLATLHSASIEGDLEVSGMINGTLNGNASTATAISNVYTHNGTESSAPSTGVSGEFALEFVDGKYHLWICAVGGVQGEAVWKKVALLPD